MNILETTGLSHTFSGDQKVLDDINIEVPEGGIYGFLGPNGAGKTTTLRLILGLLTPQHGSISIFGKSFTKSRIEILKHIGSLIESPSFYGHLTATENLKLLQKVYRCPPDRIASVLELVGLDQTKSKRAGQFSLGMKQRLGIATALLHDPRLLILDEPTNGLDPNGMVEMRELFQNLNRKGVTIIVSSHLLPEIERLVSHVGVINRGRMLFQGTLPELKQIAKQSVSAVLETNDHDKTRVVLAENGIVATLSEGRFTMPAMEREKIAHINGELVRSGVSVFEIGLVKNDLETIFMDLINN